MTVKAENEKVMIKVERSTPRFQRILKGGAVGKSWAFLVFSSGIWIMVPLMGKIMTDDKVVVFMLE